MIARLYRMLPLMIVLAVVAIIIYFVVSWRSSPNRAKELLTRLFTWITGILSVAFLLASLYALLEGNTFAFDIAVSFLAVALGALIIVQICRAVFLRHHPQYRKKPQNTTKKGRKP